MSKSFNTTATATATATTKTATPYCKVCRDAGRPESEYTSHYVKDQPGPEGKVVCPTLLNQACRICKNTGHTSSYCSQYRSRREEPRREERYFEREEPRREERYIEREQQPRREERYIEREQQPRREERVYAYNRLRDDTERQEREISDRDDSYNRDQERRSKPWLQAALKPSSSSSSPSSQPRERRGPYAHPHGPRVRLNLETNALSASKHGVVVAAAKNQEQVQQPQTAIIDVRKMHIQHAQAWGDEPFECDPEQMFREFAQECPVSNLATGAECD